MFTEWTGQNWPIILSVSDQILQFGIFSYFISIHQFLTSKPILVIFHYHDCSKAIIRLSWYELYTCLQKKKQYWKFKFAYWVTFGRYSLNHTTHSISVVVHHHYYLQQNWHLENLVHSDKDEIKLEEMTKITIKLIVYSIKRFIESWR